MPARRAPRQRATPPAPDLPRAPPRGAREPRTFHASGLLPAEAVAVVFEPQSPITIGRRVRGTKRPPRPSPAHFPPPRARPRSTRPAPTPAPTPARPLRRLDDMSAAECRPEERQEGANSFSRLPTGTCSQRALGAVWTAPPRAPGKRRSRVSSATALRGCASRNRRRARPVRRRLEPCSNSTMLALRRRRTPRHLPLPRPSLRARLGLGREGYGARRPQVRPPPRGPRSPQGKLMECTATSAHPFRPTPGLARPPLPAQSAPLGGPLVRPRGAGPCGDPRTRDRSAPRGSGG